MKPKQMKQQIEVGTTCALWILGDNFGQMDFLNFQQSQKSVLGSKFLII